MGWEGGRGFLSCRNPKAQRSELIDRDIACQPDQPVSPRSPIMLDCWLAVGQEARRWPTTACPRHGARSRRNCPYLHLQTQMSIVVPNREILIMTTLHGCNIS
ncbi:hypothetical protein J6590_030469 [Homalodisca vitripennis]|nr:hypothetical protein J6590_030469 [Homalodisca vitripennis]